MQDDRPKANVVWTCADCKQRIEGANHWDCPGKKNQHCKNCGKPESDHYYETYAGYGSMGCENFQPVRYAGGVASPEREREIYEKAMRGE